MRAEAVGPRVPTPEEIRTVERNAGKSAGEKIQLSLRAQVDLMVTGGGYESLGDIGLFQAGRKP